MVVVPPEEVEPEAVDPAPNSLPEGETLVPPTESADLPGAAEPDSQVPLVFGVPADEVGLVEDDPADPALNENLTANTELGNPNTNNLAYGSIAPAPPLPPNVNLASNNADAQPAIQTALPAPDHPQTHATEAGSFCSFSHFCLLNTEAFNRTYWCSRSGTTTSCRHTRPANPA